MGNKTKSRIKLGLQRNGEKWVLVFFKLTFPLQFDLPTHFKKEKNRIFEKFPLLIFGIKYEDVFH